MKELTTDLKHALNRGIPVVGINTADPAEVGRAACELSTEDDPIGVLTHSVGTGFTALNSQGEAILNSILSGNKSDPYAQGAPAADASQFTAPGEAVKMLLDTTERLILILIHAHRWLEEDLQGSASLWAARDRFKETGNMIVLTGPEVSFPIELQSDVVLLDHPLPDRKRLGEIVTEVHTWVGDTVKAPKGKKLERIVDALTGLSEFGAEQTLAHAMFKDGLDLQKLWSQKIKLIEQQKGLTIWTEPISMDAIGGCDRVKTYLKKLIPAMGARGIVWIDEIEKLLGGIAGDTTGVSQDQLGALLTYMQDTPGVSGAIFVGPPGAAKSVMAKAAGSLTNLTVNLDLGAAKGSLVGQSEAQIRQNLKTISAVTDGKPFFIATSNNLDKIPTELRRRFRGGIFFFDLPDAIERRSIWKIKAKQYGLKLDDPTVNDAVIRSEGWTGAEIETCAELMKLWGTDVSTAATEVLPVSTQDPEQLAKLRLSAHNRYKSASNEGLYEKPETGKGKLRAMKVN